MSTTRVSPSRIRGLNVERARLGRRGLVRSDQRGFSLVETLIAMGLFGVIAIFTLGSLASGLNGVLLGKRREIATLEATRTLEIARSLNYNDLGLVPSPTDPTIVQDTAILPNGAYLLNGVAEPIMWAANHVSHPFNPHRATINRGSTILTRYVYVTGVNTRGDPAPDIKRVTVRVTWNGAPAPVSEVRAQTTINKTGVVHTTPPLTGEAFASGGSVSITSSLLDLSTPLHMNLPNSDGSATFRAVSNTNCTTRSANLEVLERVDVPGYSVSVTADDDSRTPTSSSPDPQSSTGLLTIPGAPVSGLVGTAIGSPIACEASVNPLAHEAGTASALSSMVATTNVLGLGGLLNWVLTLADVGTQPVAQSIDHQVVSDRDELYATASAATGLVSVLKIPGVISDGLVRIDGLNYSAAVRGAEGTPSAAPTVTAPTISLRVLDKDNDLPDGSVCQSHSAGYCVISVQPSAAGFTGLSLSASNNFTQLVGLDLVSLTYTTQVNILPPAKSSIAGQIGPNGEKRWSAEYTPVAISASLDASVPGISLIDADVEMNLGTVRAEACAGATCL